MRSGSPSGRAGPLRCYESLPHGSRARGHRSGGERALDEIARDVDVRSREETDEPLKPSRSS
jgi:hypothetical protein